MSRVNCLNCDSKYLGLRCNILVNVSINSPSLLIHVIAIILCQHLIKNSGLVFYKENLKGISYLDILDNKIDPLETYLENEDDWKNYFVLHENLLPVQKNSAQPHYVLPVLKNLNDDFSDRKIGENGSI